VIPIIVFEKDAHVASVLVQILSKGEGLAVGKSATDWIDLRRKVTQHPSSVVVLGPDNADTDLHRVLDIGGDFPGTAFVLVADQLDADTLQAAMRHGIRDVVAVEDAERELSAAVRRAHAMTESAALPRQPENARRGKVVALFGAKGGTGKTMVATNLAVLCAEAKVSTALFDARCKFGDCSAFLGLRPDRTLGDIAAVPGQLDDGVLGRVLATHPSGLKVLCAPNDPLHADNINPDLVGRVLDGLRRSFDLIFVDTGPSLDPWTLTVLQECDLAYLVTSLELPAVKDAKLGLAVLDRLHADGAKVRIVLNRADSKVGFPREEVAKALQCPVAAELSSDVSVPRAVNNGVPLHTESSRSKTAKGLNRLATELRAQLLPATPSSESRSLLTRSLRSRPSES
jgi:pilus assembly protein CpaE